MFVCLYTQDEPEGAFFCGVGYYEENSDVTDDMYVDQPLRYIEENVSFLENDEVELIRVPVPEFRESDAADIVHDFKMVWKHTNKHTHLSYEYTESGFCLETICNASVFTYY